MPLDEDERYRLLAKYLPEGWSLSEELALLALQASAKQKIVRERLQVLDRYLEPASDEAGNGDVAAANLGVGRRQLLNLVTKLRKLGPTRALTPGFRNVPRASVARTGLGRRAEWHLANLLKIEPGLRLSDVELYLRAVCEREGVTLPGTSSIRKRVLILRGNPTGAADLGIFGATLLVDQIYLDLPVIEQRPFPSPIVTLIVDQRTKLILGHHLMPQHDNGEGLQSALEDWERRIENFAEARLFVAEKIEYLTWVIPWNLEFFAENALTESKSVAERVEIVNSGPRRHGAAIMRTIGDRLPPFSFKPMNSEQGEGSLSDRSSIALKEARELVAASVDRWNANILADLTVNVGGKVPPKSQLHAINRALRELIEPVIIANRESWSVLHPDT